MTSLVGIQAIIDQENKQSFVVQDDALRAELANSLQQIGSDVVQAMNFKLYADARTKLPWYKKLLTFFGKRHSVLGVVVL